MLRIAPRLDHIKPSPSSMAAQRVRELRASGREIVGLTTGEPDFDTPDNIKEAAVRAIAKGQTKYTDVAGTLGLRKAIQVKFKRENGLDYSPAEIIVSNGGKQVIFNAFMCTIHTNDEVIVPTPYWVSYPDIVVLAGGRPVFVPCPPEKGFKLQPEDLERSITQNIRWLVINAPNNPSGAVYSFEEMKALTEVLMRHPQVWILSDDIYEHILYDGREFVTPAQVEPALKERTLTLNGVSKAYAMTGWRIGYAGAPAALIRAMVKLQSQSTTNASSISQAAAVEALAGPQHFIVERTRLFQERRDTAVLALNAAAGITCHYPEGAFYAFPSCAGVLGKKTPAGKILRSDEDFTNYLLDAYDLAVLQGGAYGVSPFFRISFATSMETLREGCARIQRACGALVRGSHSHP
jgi:aspartate aminotransferase